MTPPTAPVDKVIQNKVYAERLGFVPGAIVAGATTIDAAFVTGVIDRQVALQVPADGVCGPQTYSAVLLSRQGALAAGIAGPADLLTRAGLVAVCELKRLWLRNIIDLPPKTDYRYETCRSTIDQLIRSRLGIYWYWRPEYEQDTFEFCGTGPAYGWRAAGLKLPLRQDLFASTLRLDCYGSYTRWDADTPNAKPPTGPYRMMVKLTESSRPADAIFPDGSDPREGDIVMVGGKNTGPGKHICTAEAYNPFTGVFTTLECNGTGLGPNGQRQHGVVRASRRIGLMPGQPDTTYFVRRIIRPSPQDLDVGVVSLEHHP